MFLIWGQVTRKLVIMRKLIDSLAKNQSMESSTVRSGLDDELARVYAAEGSNLNLCCQAKVFPIEPQAGRIAFLSSLI